MKFLTTSLVLAALLLPAAAWAEPSPAAASSRPAVVRDVIPKITLKAPGRIMPEVSERRLDNGIPVYVVEHSKLPIEDVFFVFADAGGYNDPDGKYGLASATLECLLRGAGERDALAFAEAVDSLGAEIISQGRELDCLSLHVSCISRTLPEVMDLAADALMLPAFPQRELELRNKEYADFYLATRRNPGWMAGFIFDRLLFGEASRYGTYRWGDPVQRASLTRQDLSDYYRQYFRPENMFICCSGSVSPDDLVAVLNRRLGRWSPAPFVKSASAETAVNVPAAKPAARYIPAEPAKESTPLDGRFFVVDYPGAAQSDISVGRVGFARSDPDYLAIRVMNSVLGGPFSSRLNMNLRERSGYTYSAYSRYYAKLHHGRFLAGAAVQNDKTVPALQEILKEIDSMRQPVPKDELQRIVDGMAYALPDQFNSIRDINFYMRDLIIYNLPKDYADTYVSRLKRLTPEDIRRAAERILDPDKMIVLIVGDAKAIEPQLKKAGLRARLITADEVLGPEFVCPVPDSKD